MMPKIPTPAILDAVEKGATTQALVAARLNVSKQHAARLLRRAGCRKIWVTHSQFIQLFK